MRGFFSYSGFTLALFLSFSCSIVELGKFGNADSDIWKGSSHNPAPGGSSTPAKSSCYVTAVSYPDGYDWLRDEDRDAVRCSLVVFVDGVPRLKVPIGESRAVGADADLHRIMDGSLYSWSNSDDKTVVRRYGEVLFEYYSRESIRDVLLKDNDLYTLGVPSSGEGFSFRKNGETLFVRNSGYPFERLYQDDEKVGFSFCEVIKAAGPSTERYYNVLDTNVVQVALRNDIQRVWDVISVNSGILYLATLRGVSSPVLIRSDEIVGLSSPDSSSLLSFRFLPGGDGCYVETVGGSPAMTSYLWNGTKSVFKSVSGFTIFSCCIDEEGICGVLVPSLRTLPPKIFQNERIWSVPEGYWPMGTSVSAMVNGILCVGLSSLTGGRPALWKDGELHPLEINGYITGVYSVR